MAVGVRTYNPAIYAKDMYKASFIGSKLVDEKRSSVYNIVKNAEGSGEKEDQLLDIDSLDRHTAENQDINFEFPQQGWAWYCKYWTYSKGLALSYEANEDSVKMREVLVKFANRLGRAAQYTKEQFAARVFNEGGNLSGDWIFNGTASGIGTDSSGDLMYDSKPLFNLTGNTRSTKGGGTYYNSVAGLTLTYANFKTVYNLHTATNNVNEIDQPTPNPADTLLVTPGADEAAAKQILQSEHLPGGQLNDMNPYYNRLDRIVSWDYLNDASGGSYPFYVGKRNHDEFQFRERQRPMIRFFIDHTNAGSKAYYIERWGVWLKNWRVWTRGGGTSA